MNKILTFILAIMVGNSLLAQKEEILFYDDFIDNRNGWGINNTEHTSLELKNGKYYFQSKTKGQNWVLYNANCKPFDGNKDFKVEWSFQQEKGTEDNGVGIFCYQNDERSKGFGINFSIDGQWSILKPSDSASATDWKDDRVVKKGNNVSNTVAILKIGKNFGQIDSSNYRLINLSIHYLNNLLTHLLNHLLTY